MAERLLARAIDRAWQWVFPKGQAFFINENDDDRRRGPRWKRYNGLLCNFQGFFHFTARSSVSGQLVIPSTRCGISVSTHDAASMNLALRVPLLFSLYLTLAAPWLHKRVRKLCGEGYTDRVASLEVHSWRVWLTPWGKDHEWSSKDPWWVQGRSFAFHPLALLLGRMSSAVEVVKRIPVTVAMPEGLYPGEARYELHHLKYKRWPFTKTLKYTYLDMKKGVPHPGKGENSWDLDDGTWGLSVPGHDVPAVVARMVESVMRSREQRASLGWVPTPCIQPGGISVGGHVLQYDACKLQTFCTSCQAELKDRDWSKLFGCPAFINALGESLLRKMSVPASIEDALKANPYLTDAYREALAKTMGVKLDPDMQTSKESGSNV